MTKNRLTVVARKWQLSNNRHFENTSWPNENDTPDLTSGPWCNGADENYHVYKIDLQFKVNQKSCELFLQKNKGKKGSNLKLADYFCLAICKRNYVLIKIRKKKKKNVKNYLIFILYPVELKLNGWIKRMKCSA